LERDFEIKASSGIGGEHLSEFDIVLAKVTVSDVVFGDQGRKLTLSHAVGGLADAS
jgi:hypothetical protein